MEKINIPFFYQLGGQLGKLIELKVNETAPIEVVLAALQADTVVNSLLLQFPVLKVCRATGQALHNQFSDLLKELGGGKFKIQDMSQPISDPALQFQLQQMVNTAKDFQTLLTAELQNLPSYHVTQKGIYSMTDLIANAEDVFPSSVKDKLNDEVINEIRESGRCLAFDIPTASAFHILRATESVIHLFYVAVCKPTNAKKKLNNWAAYITEFRQSTDADAKRIAELLQQLKDHDRNLIMHPEIVLKPDEAHTLFELVQGVIMAMAVKLPSQKKK